MITIIIYGLDQFVVERLSSELTNPIANVCEVTEEDVNFIAPESMVFHNGFEQTSWQVFVEVVLPKKIEVLQEEIAQVLIQNLKDVSIHQEIIFKYYLHDERVISVNEDYPRYITESNVVNTENEEDFEEEPTNEEEVYEGDIFKDFNKETK